MEESFNEWMKRIRNDYYSDNEQMNNAFERLKNQKNKRDENNIKCNTMDSSSKSNDVDRWIHLARR